MKKELKMLYFLLIFLLLFLLSLALLKKQQTFYGSVYIQEYIDEQGIIKKDLYLLSSKNLNISLIDYIILETNQGNMFVNASKLEYSNSLIKININNIGSIKYPSNNVLIYGEKVSLLSYLLSNIF
ncbi:hypothetical protein [Spiroplasma floricola]|uniref:Uncharacterized protein n=1 Tax=Spiroplasma floricola 23-6 TaxID=1336749 RepID=A0A2K8SF22_9MOLU|nr:hypothetical protein [Spiroplasma floricola]AUB31838.1 hypothetical protein SFLOR_v1c07900 [Spiroplasma floricola 23-6]